MGPVICPERSPPAARSPPAKLSFSESEPDSNSSFFECSDAESIAGEKLNNSQAQPLWDKESLMKFGAACDLVPNDENEFDRLNNKLLIALKTFSPTSHVYCLKCKKMAMMTKRGKVNKTYQFNCTSGKANSHTVSATQILTSLPDGFILKHLAGEPRHIYNQTLTWIGQDHLSPELLERTASRNAVKRYSAHRSPMKGPTSSLLTSRNTANEVLSELRSVKTRMNELEKELNATKTNVKLLEEMNAALTEQLKAAKEENNPPLPCSMAVLAGEPIPLGHPFSYYYILLQLVH